MKSVLILIVSLFISANLLASELDTNSLIYKKELELDAVFKKLRNSKEDTDFIKYNKEFKQKLKAVLLLDVAFNHPFDSLKSMSKIKSPDDAFRLFNWNVELESGVNTFHCFILKKEGTVIELRDNYRFIQNAELKTLSNKNWYGALYYKIIPLKRGKYTLLGWNGKDKITTQKVIETMSLGRKSAKFGLALFEYPNSRVKKKRIILEYSDEAYVSLKFYETKTESQIVFSHLSPSTPQMEGFYQYYYPDLSYDRFFLKKGRWVFESDSEVKNPKSSQDKNYNAPE